MASQELIGRMGRAFCKLLVSVSSLSVQARQAYPVCSMEESTKLVVRRVKASCTQKQTSILNKKQASPPQAIIMGSPFIKFCVVLRSHSTATNPCMHAATDPLLPCAGDVIHPVLRLVRGRACQTSCLLCSVL